MRNYQNRNFLSRRSKTCYYFTGLPLFLIQHFKLPSTLSYDDFLRPMTNVWKHFVIIISLIVVAQKDRARDTPMLGVGNLQKPLHFPFLCVWGGWGGETQDFFLMNSP